MRPTYYILTENDQIIPPRLQGFFAQYLEIGDVAFNDPGRLKRPGRTFCPPSCTATTP